jgi:non-ribosomal peptide synthase protein (TIGR01720 family)
MPARHALEITAAIRDTTLTITLSWLPETLNQPDITQLSQHLTTILTTITNHTNPTTHTPSDFPLAALGQDEIEEFEELAIEMERGNRP